jgi:hypothetical protein
MWLGIIVRYRAEVRGVRATLHLTLYVSLGYIL